MSPRNPDQGRSARKGSAGPGRPRQRAGGRPSSPVEEPDSTPSAREPQVPVWRRGLHLTRRALILALLVVVLAISFANSLRIYLGQQHALAVAEQQIRERTAQVEELETELARWNDSEYVRTQARLRLGWVLPGETAYRVVDDEGNPIGGGVAIESEQQLPAGEHEPVWWDRLANTIRAADAPTRKVFTN